MLNLGVSLELGAWNLELLPAHSFFRRQPAMNIPFPPMSCGQIVSELPAANARPFDFNSGNVIGSNSGCVELKCSTTPVVSALVNVQTEKINLPPGFKLFAA